MPTAQQNGSEPALQSLGNLKRWLDRYLGETYGVVPMHRISGALTEQQIGSKGATAAGLTAHEADTTNVHGITDTSVLATDSDVSSAVATHEADTTNVHGIADTTVLATDAELATHAADTTSVHGITDTAQVALKNAANTFTEEQTIQGTEPGSGLIVDGGATDANLYVVGSDVVLNSTGGLFLITGAGSSVSVDGKRMVSVANATAATDAVNRQFGDGRWETKDALLTAIAALSMVDNRIVVGTGTDTVELWTVTDFVKTLLDDADAATARTTLGAATATPPAVRVTHSADQAITTATLTNLSFDTEQYDTDAFHDNATNPTRLTAPVAGRYMVGAAVRWQPNVTGRRELQLRVNASTVIAGDNREPVAEAGVRTDQSVSTPYVFAAGDYVEIRVRQGSGINLNCETGAPAVPQFYMHYLGPTP